MLIKDQITFADFEKVDMRVGKVLKVEDFPEAQKRAYKLSADIGGPFTSEVLTLGVSDDTEDPSNWIVITPFKEGEEGGQIR